MTIGVPELQTFWTAAKPTVILAFEEIQAKWNNFWNAFTGRAEELIPEDPYESEMDFYIDLHACAVWAFEQMETEATTLAEFLAQFPLAEETPPTGGGD